jgi:predicted glycogen debranching enzyme
MTTEDCGVAARTDDRSEWLEADGLGGFASGTVAGVRTRRYHALLLAATAPPTGRTVLVNGFDAWVETEGGRFAISSQRYLPDVVDPDGTSRIDGFTNEPWPHWSYRLADGTLVEQELFVPKGLPLVALLWRVHDRRVPATLTVRPFLSGRDYHSLHHENPDFRFDARRDGDVVSWQPYASVPGTVALASGGYFHEPHWYRRFLYDEERARGLDFAEDLGSPGYFRFDLARGEAVLLLASDAAGAFAPDASAQAMLASLRDAERTRRQAFRSGLERAGDAYLVKRGSGRTIIAGYPWFADWGRDTFISIRGLGLATGRLEEARDIFQEWAHAVSEGMLHNRFPDRPDEQPDFNSVDAALWYVIAVHEYLQAAARAGISTACGHCGGRSGCLEKAVLDILSGYAKGTRHRIRMDADGLLSAGEPGVQLTWMDAKVGDWVVTPRIGKPVEVQALWINALGIGAELDGSWREPFERARRSFGERFWNEERSCLFDVVDADHHEGAVDASLRPNQIFAVGGLPMALLEGERARRVVDAVETHLLTPLGPRSLAPGETGYVPRYEGGVRERDGAYHQGTVWPWLLGAFVEAWVRVRGGTKEAREEARERFLPPLWQHLREAGLGHASEIADAEPPHTPRGCPFQAWSVAEAIRLERVVLAGQEPSGPGSSSKRSRNRASDEHGRSGARPRIAVTLWCPRHPSGRTGRSRSAGQSWT